jgi:hypothetical protein
MTARALPLTLCCLCALVFTPGIAQAAEEREPKAFKESLPEISNPLGVTVNQADGSVLVAQGQPFEPGEVKVFPAAGGPSTATLTGQAGAQKTPQGDVSFINQRSVGLAVDAAGDVFVSDTLDHVVDKFGPAGEGFPYLCQFSGPGRGCVAEPAGASTFGQTTGIALDPAGDLFVADPENNRVVEFDSSGGDLATISMSGRPDVTSPPVGVAVDSVGDLFVEQQELPHHIVELADGGAGRETPVSPRTTGISFDFDSAGLLLAEPLLVTEFSPLTGELVPGAAFSTTIEPESVGGVATRETSNPPDGNVYIVNRAHRSVDVYSVPPLVKPIVQSEYVSAVTSTSAKLNAVIEPALRATNYRFQYGPDQSYSSGELPAAPGALIPGTQSSAIGAVQLDGLTPGTTYHYRVVAISRAGTTFGPDQTFTTIAPPEEGLPDGRVYEMVSPLDKNGGAAYGPEEPDSHFEASTDGTRVAYLSLASFGESPSNILANQYLATRGPDGWTSENLSPPAVPGGYFKGTTADPYYAFSGDLSHGLVRNGLHASHEEGHPFVLNPPLPGTGAPAGYETFYLRDNNIGAYQALLTNTPTGLSNAQYQMFLEGATPDLAHAVVATANLGATAFALDEWSSGTGLVAVNVLPEGASTPSAVLGSGDAHGSEMAHAISSDGSRVFWSIGGSRGQGSEPVFVRENPARPESPLDEGRCTVLSDACTLQLPPGEFVDASASGELVLLSTGEVYDVEHQRELANVTGGAGGFRGELGASEDLSSVYFVDTAVLAGTGANAFGQSPRGGENNVYLYHRGDPPVFITMLAPGAVDFGDWSASVSEHTARVTPDGGSAVFESRAALTGHDNRDIVTGSPDDEIFLYHAATDNLSCVSCNPTGQRPNGSAIVPAGEITETHAGNFPAFYAPRVLSRDGSRVFFNSSEALAAQDTNGAQDVYEYEGGHPRLISSGTGAASTFLDASESGDDVFFLTANQLVPGDTDQLVDLYDARVGGGVPAPATGTACTGGGCQGVPAPAPLFATPAGATAQGLGNFGPAPAVSTLSSGSKPLTRSQKLAKALQACRKDRRHAKRAACETVARKRFGPVKKSNKKEAR